MLLGSQAEKGEQVCKNLQLFCLSVPSFACALLFTGLSPSHTQLGANCQVSLSSLQEMATVLSFYRNPSWKMR